MANSIQLSWQDICERIVEIYPEDRNASRLRTTTYPELAAAVTDWNTLGKFLRRVPPQFFQNLREWMEQRALIHVPVPLTWLRDGRP